MKKINYQKIANIKLNNFWNHINSYKIKKISMTDLTKICQMDIEKAPKTAIRILNVMENKYLKNIIFPFHISHVNVIPRAIR